MKETKAKTISRLPELQLFFLIMVFGFWFFNFALKFGHNRFQAIRILLLELTNRRATDHVSGNKS